MTIPSTGLNYCVFIQKQASEYFLLYMFVMCPDIFILKFMFLVKRDPPFISVLLAFGHIIHVNKPIQLTLEQCRCWGADPPRSQKSEDNL